VPAEGSFSAHTGSSGRSISPRSTSWRTVDLSGSTFLKHVTFHGTTFAAPVLLGATTPRSPATFRHGIDFSLAVFDDLASADGAVIHGSGLFGGARFRADASLVGAQFDRVAFDAASFGGTALFRQTTFSRAATFVDTNFESRTDFTQAEFDRGVDFGSAQFAKGATFLGSTFIAPDPSSPAANFQTATSGGDFEFTFAKFLTPRIPKNAKGNLGDIAIFSNLVCGSALVFRYTTFASRYQIAMDQIQVRDISFDVADVSQVDGEDNQRTVLQDIETSAKNRDDLAQANDAQYRLRVMASRHYGPVGHALDFVFYRGIAGYFVRPLRPVVALLVLVAVLSVARTVSRRRSDQAAAGPRRRSWRTAGGWLSRAAHSILDTFALMAPRRGGDAANASLGLRLEAFTYRVLIVCALLGLANSNPTLRQMVDSLF